MDDNYSAEGVLKKYQSAKRDKVTWEDLWRKYQSKFDGDLLYTKEEWQSNVSMPLLYQAVTKMVAREMKQYWGRKFWELEAVDPANKDAVKRKDRLYEIQIMGHRGRMKKWQRFAMFKYLYGPGIVKLYWDNGAPTFDVIDPRHIYPEPGAETIEEAEYVCHEALVSKEYVRRMFDEGVFTTEFEQDSIDTMLMGSGDELKGAENSNRDKSTKANVIEYWEDDRIIVLLNKRWKVRDEANPYDHKKKPFLFNICLDSINAIWGNPIAWNCWNLYDKLDRHVNMRLDLARLLVNPPTWWGSGAGIPADPILKVSPGKIHKINRIDQTSHFRFDGALDANNVAIELLKRGAQDTTALNDSIMGSNNPSMPDTAMGANTMYQSANERIELYTVQNDDFCVKFIEMWCLLNKQFLIQKKPGILNGITSMFGADQYESYPIKVKDKEGFRVEQLTKDDLDIASDIIIRAPATATNKLAQQQNEIQLYGMLKGDPEVDHKASLRGLLEHFDRNVEEYMLSTPEKVQNVMEQAQLQAQIQQVLAPPAPMEGAPTQAPGAMVQGDMMNNTAATTNQGAPSAV